MQVIVSFICLSLCILNNTQPEDHKELVYLTRTSSSKEVAVLESSKIKLSSVATILSSDGIFCIKTVHDNIYNIFDNNLVLTETKELESPFNSKGKYLYFGHSDGNVMHLRDAIRSHVSVLNSSGEEEFSYKALTQFGPGQIHDNMIYRVPLRNGLRGEKELFSIFNLTGKRETTVTLNADLIDDRIGDSDYLPPLFTEKYLYLISRNYPFMLKLSLEGKLLKMIRIDDERFENVNRVNNQFRFMNSRIRHTLFGSAVIQNDKIALMVWQQNPVLETIVIDLNGSLLKTIHFAEGGHPWQIMELLDEHHAVFAPVFGEDFVRIVQIFDY